jgi:hypothetical protein
VKFRRIPKKTKLVKETSTINKERMCFTILEYYQFDYMSLCGLAYDDKRVDIRICNRHILKKEVKEIKWLDRYDRSRKTTVAMYLPPDHRNINEHQVPQ